MKQKTTKKFISFVLCMLMVISTMFCIPLTTFAASYPAVSLNVPWFCQRRYGDCGIASICMVEAYKKGYSTNSDTVYNAVWNYNNQSITLSSYANLGYSTISNSLSSIYNELKKGNPVIVYRTGNQHYSVIYAYKGSTTTLEKSGFKVLNTYRNSSNTVFDNPGSLGYTDLESWLSGNTWTHTLVRTADKIPLKDNTSKYTVSYNANGGSGAPAAQTKTQGTTLKLSTTIPTRTGYKFQGWATSSSGSVAYAAGGSYMQDASITLYAVWIPNILTVSFNANGGLVNSSDYKLVSDIVCNTDGTTKTQIWKYDEPFLEYGLCNAETVGLYNPGYTFYGWGKKASGGTVFDENDVNIKPSQINAAIRNGDCSTTLYALWVSNEYTLVKSVTDEDTGNTYEYYTGRSTWEDAEKFCEEKGGHLVTITSEAENSLVMSLINEDAIVWIGATDKNTEGEWEWVTGESFSYTNWYSNEPNNGNNLTKEDYAEMRKSLEQWNDVSNYTTNNNGFVLEKHIEMTGVVDGLHYVIQDGNVTIVDCDENISGSIAVPNTISGYPVTAIGYETFAYHDNIESVTIPDSVTSIGEAAFHSCTGLTNVVIPDGVTDIGYYAFCGCTRLTDVTIPDSVVSLGEAAFYGCKGITNVTIPDSVTDIGMLVFADCDSLTTVKIPNSVTSIGTGAFFDCDGLISVEIPNGVTDIEAEAFMSCDSLTNVMIPDSVTVVGESVFEYCYNLTNITVDANNKYYSSADGVLFNKDKTELIQYPTGNSRTNYTIPDSVTSINGYAFYGCVNLADVVIPDSVIVVGDYTFGVCSFLTTVTIGKNVANIGSSAFNSCISLSDVYYTGSEEEWNNITIGSDNDYLLNATRHYNNQTIPEDAPQIVVESKKTVKGKEFTVSVDIKNNPGFMYLELTPVYSSDLTLVSVTNGELISDFTEGRQYIWVADGDITEDGTLMTFTFTTTDETEAGKYNVSFILRGCVNYDEEMLDIIVASGTIEVIDFTYGDANGDGVINGQDIVRLKKYLASYDYETETSTVEIGAGADANGDGVINGQDVVRLKKYLANYDYETDTSTIVLGPTN